MKATVFPFTKSVSITIVFLYAIGFLIVFTTVGVLDAAHQFVTEGVLLILWLWIAHSMLDEPSAEDLPIRKAGLELALGLGGLLLAAAMFPAYYLGVVWLVWVAILVFYCVPLIVFFALRYSSRPMGLSVGAPRAWLALLAIVVVNYAVGFVVGHALPAGHLPIPTEATSAGQASNSLSVFAVGARVLLIAAIPEELYFRVYLQPRLAHYLPVGWAIMVQALLFSACHVPQHIIHFGYPWALALAGVLSITNGLIGGYLWWRTRSLPLLIVLHLFAYPRLVVQV